MADQQTKTNQRKNNSNKNNKQKSDHHRNDNKLRLFIDASKKEETRVVVAKNGRIEDLEVESLVRKQIKGNIYLAKVTRVEPSLQAAFVNYGGNRHGFLPFSEIHPDYYRIPVADRERLMEEQAELERKAAEEAAKIAEEEDRKAEEENAPASSTQDDDDDNVVEIEDDEAVIEAGVEASDSNDDASSDDSENDGDNENDSDTDENKINGRGRRGRYGRRRNGRNSNRKHAAARNNGDSISEDDDELNVEPFWKRMRRAYKIQEVIKRGQIVLIQVGKEERGNKGAAVTTYITLPGRYCVLMPNTPQSGGVSRKISNYKDRKRMRDILKDLNVPQGMSVILRTAGTQRTKAEIKRDLDYLMRLWNNARDLTLQSTAPALINEEGSLIRRAIRDIYNKDIHEVIVSGADGYKTAHNMMKMLMPSHAKKVVQYKEETPLFITEHLEKQIEAIHSPQVELKSGGYLVINPTEALVSVDVNSGRSTKERNIDDTALRTNIEAAEEIARQLKLRDLGGLVVIDFIDMENRRFNGKVERAMRDALAGDRARIQIGRISSFGLMEMSRQRLHPSLTETHFETCPHCHGMGIVKTVDTLALSILRGIEEQALTQGDSYMTITLSNKAALYLFNHYRHAITSLEQRYNLSITFDVGEVEDESGFTLEHKPKPADDIQADEDDNDEAIAEDTQNTIVDKAEDSNEKEEKDDKPKSSNSRGRRRKKKTDDEPQAEKPEEKKPEEEAEIKETKKPVAKKPRKSSAKPQKIAIEEKADASQKEEKNLEPAKPVETVEVSTDATNDNGNEDASDKKEEVVNQKPEKKKKGWWNKLSS
jgi:ribonuclease E